MKLILLIALVAGLTSAATADTAPETKGEQLLAPFKQQLMKALKDGMQAGPQEAVETCHLVAPGIPGQASPEGVAMGRTSHKVRNPDNAPTAWQRELLQYYLHHEDREPKTRKLDNGRMAYAEPIEVKAMCLMCHGKSEQISPAIQTKLDELYPEDNATGFSDGDFRGIFWVTWPRQGDADRS